MDKSRPAKDAYFGLLDPDCIDDEAYDKQKVERPH